MITNRRVYQIVWLSALIHCAVNAHAAAGRIGDENHAFLQTPPPDPLRQYRLTGGQFEFFNGERWNISDGEISLQHFDVLVTEEGYERAVYGVTAFSIVAEDLLGAIHTITAVPNGLPSPIFQDPYVPEAFLDIGLVDVYPEGSLGMLVYDLSIDGASVNPLDSIGGPAFVGSTWLGTFPLPTDFSVSMLADLRSRNLFGQVTLTGTIVPEPASVVPAFILLLISGAPIAHQQRSARSRQASNGGPA